MDYYKILQLPNTSTIKQIKKKYRKLVKKYHPDSKNKNSKFSEDFLLIQKAYSILSNNESRKKYDDDLVNDFDFLEKKSNSNFINVNNLFINDSDSESEYSESKYSDNLEIKIDTTLEDLYNEKTKLLNYKRFIICNKCKGMKIDIEKAYTFDYKYNCKECNGRGKINLVNNIGYGNLDIPIKCYDCEGLGFNYNEEIQCKKCIGMGRIYEENILKYKLSNKYMNNFLILIKNEGNIEKINNPRSNLKIIINELEHKFFKRSICGNDLLFIYRISLDFALAKINNRYIKIKELSNKILKLEIPDKEIIYPNSIKILKGKGMNKNGNLIIIFEVEFSHIKKNIEKNNSFLTNYIKKRNINYIIENFY